MGRDDEFSRGMGDVLLIMMKVPLTARRSNIDTSEMANERQRQQLMRAVKGTKLKF